MTGAKSPYFQFVMEPRQPQLLVIELFVMIEKGRQIEQFLRAEKLIFNRGG